MIIFRGIGMHKPVPAPLRFSIRHGFVSFATIAFLLTTVSGLGQTPYFFFNLAGNPGSSGTNDLPGPAARFNAPSGVGLDSMANVYVADTGNHTIREIAVSGTVSTVAGIPGSNGMANGAAAVARFNLPTGVATDANGGLYVADWGNHLIRKISLGQVTTLAGLAGRPGWADGSNTIAQFNHPAGVAVDSLGQVFIADQGNHAIRVVAVDGSIETVAGSPGVPGSVDGVGTNAQFNLPSGVAIGNQALFVADTGNDTIREITISNNQWLVTTLAGSAGLRGTNDLIGAAARFNAPTGVAVAGAFVIVSDFGNETLRVVTIATGQTVTGAGTPGTSGTNIGAQNMVLMNWPAGIAVDGNNNFYVAERGNNVILEGSPVTGPVILTQPQSQTSVPDGSASYSVVAIGVQPLTYQWKLNNQDLANAVTSSVEIDDLEAGDGGQITVEVTSPYGNVTSSNADLIVAEPGAFITWAGTPGQDGSTDGAGGDALFNYPGDLKSDTNGNIFVADSGNSTIREIIPSGLTDCQVKTLAGSAGEDDFADGAGTNALFSFPYGLFIDKNGTVYVADSYNSAIRKMLFDGTNWNVITLAGRPGTTGTNDGTGTNGLFNVPVSLAVGLAGNIYVADYYNYELRQVTPGGDVSTLVGSELINGGADAFPANWVYGLSSVAGLTVDANGNLFVADDGNNQIFEVSTNDGEFHWTAVN
jgi:sugar lactone lactonase YvrE